MGLSPHESVKTKSMHELYDDLRHEGRLQYIRLEKKDVTQLCGDFQYNLNEQQLPGTNWTAHFEYSKVPVNNWKAWDIPPTDRSDLDTARFVLENKEYMSVYLIVSFVWILTIINEVRMILQFMLAVCQMRVVYGDDKVIRKEDEDFRIVAFTWSAKVMGLACVVYRLFICMFITVVGCQFLMWTSTNIELILNALALTFVLELDHITYKATISRSRQNLISKLKPLTWSDPVGFSSRHPNVSKLVMMISVLGSGAFVTWLLRDKQHDAYRDMFALVAATCLFQGPTPGYWSQFHATFPAPGLCETLLELKCEAPIVGESGRPCVEDWEGQRLCKFYVRTDSMFSTWSSIDWMRQGPCVAYPDGKGPYPVMSLDIKDDRSTFSILANVCQRMYQQQPMIMFQGKQRYATGPRIRVYPYKEFTPAAPFWCGYKGGADAVLTRYKPAPFRTWRQRLKTCRSTTLVYSSKTNSASSSSWVGSEETQMEANKVAKLNNMTKPTRGAFNGIWLSKTWGVVVISQNGDKAMLSNPNLPYSPQKASVNGGNITLDDLDIKGELKAGKIYLSGANVMSDNIVLVSQADEIKNIETKRKQKKHRRRRQPFVIFIR
uniref:Uncharacterized protein n=1 Tax=Zooxanthella nutricula TaxID=1333877 RepID=A0A7S2M092_9DINO